MCVGTDHHAAVRLRLSVGEVANSPGQVVRGHARRPGKVIGQPAVLIRQRAALHRHVGQRGVLWVVAEGEGECGLVDRFIKAGEGLPGVDRTELSYCQVAMKRKRNKRIITRKKFWVKIIEDDFTSEPLSFGKWQTCMSSI